MSIWLILLTFLNIVLLAGLSFSLFMRVKEKKEDQRLTKGLQLLQNKISILEDLSDKTDEQVRKMIHTLDQKAQEVRQTLVHSEEQAQRIESMIQQGFESAATLQQQIPHHEMQTRQKTSLYVKAAKLAHQGMTLDEILDAVDLTPAEIQMIIKVNKEKLQFSESDLPSWAHTDNQPRKTEIIQQAELDIFAEALAAQNQFHTSPASNVSTGTVSVAQPQMPTVSGDSKMIKPFEFKRITKP